MCWAVNILVETSETNLMAGGFRRVRGSRTDGRTHEIVVSEQLNLLPSLFHQDIFRCERMDRKHL